jgi:hypothetical protein
VTYISRSGLPQSSDEINIASNQIFNDLLNPRPIHTVSSMKEPPIDWPRRAFWPQNPASAPGGTQNPAAKKLGNLKRTSQRKAKTDYRPYCHSQRLTRLSAAPAAYLLIAAINQSIKMRSVWQAFCSTFLRSPRLFHQDNTRH